MNKTSGQPCGKCNCTRNHTKILDIDYTKQITLRLVEQAILNIILRRILILIVCFKLKEPGAKKSLNRLFWKNQQINILNDDTPVLFDLD